MSDKRPSPRFFDETPYQLDVDVLEIGVARALLVERREIESLDQSCHLADEKLLNLKTRIAHLVEPEQN